MRRTDAIGRRLIMPVLLGAVVFISSVASALPPVNVTSEGVAMKGYDPVAYFTVGEPVKGLEGFEYVWNGAKWRFSSKKHMELFTADPEKYAPQYGGY
jgi:YHS domain-containing protein